MWLKMMDIYSPIQDFLGWVETINQVLDDPQGKELAYEPLIKIFVINPSA